MGLRVDEFLAEFGAGKAVPGAGCAVATTAAIAGGLAMTVAQLTLNREKYRQFHTRATFLGQEAQRITDLVVPVVDADADVFKRVIRARQARDMATDPKTRDQLNRVALDHQKAATELPLKVAGLCVDLAEYALELYDEGFQSARGDSGVAAVFAHACARGAIFVVQLNLKDYKNDEWVRAYRKTAAQLVLKTEAIGGKVRRRLRSGLGPAECDTRIKRGS